MVEDVERGLGGVGEGGGVVEWVRRQEGRVGGLVRGGRRGEAWRVVRRVEEICEVWGVGEVGARVRGEVERVEREMGLEGLKGLEGGEGGRDTGEREGQGEEEERGRS